jgi:hypothetical protein
VKRPIRCASSCGECGDCIDYELDRLTVGEYGRWLLYGHCDIAKYHDNTERFIGVFNRQGGVLE